MHKRLIVNDSLLLAALVASTLGIAPAANAQAVTWEGQTGGIVTPFAYLPESPVRGVGRPVVSFQLLDAGEIVGDRFQISLTGGLFDRVEVGITRSAVSAGETSSLGTLFDRGFTTLHGKVNLLRENEPAASLPAISAGVVVRWQREHIAGHLGVATQNADLYAVATRTLRLNESVSVVLNGGARMTNASLMGIAGNAPSWTARAFGAVALGLGPNLVAGAELSQQPAEVDGVPSAEMPATSTLFVRLTPVRNHLSVYVALVRAAGVIGPGLDVRAQNRLAAGTAYRF